MNPPKVHIVDEEGLFALLEEIMTKETFCSKEEAFDRFKRACRVAYDVSRNGLDPANPRIMGLIGTAHHNTNEGSGVNAATGCLIMQAASEYLEIEQNRDPVKFRTQFIFCLDKAVQAAGVGIEETHDARTKQSAEERSTQPPATS
jgi:hypothetical protein